MLQRGNKIWSVCFYVFVLISFGLAPLSVDAVTITDGFTFSVASDFGPNTGTHFHSSTGGDFGNPAGIAEVGEYFTERVRGLSEYNLAGLVAGPAFVTFDVLDNKGLFFQENDFPFIGNINIVAYTGNQAEDLSDFEAVTIGSVATLSTSSLAVGNVLSFDITTIYNNALTNGLTSLGIRLQVDAATNPQGGALQFNMFRLTSTDDTVVPEPMTLSLISLGVLGMATRRRVM